MAIITFVNPNGTSLDVEAESGMSVMQAAKRAGIDGIGAEAAGDRVVAGTGADAVGAAIAENRLNADAGNGVGRHGLEGKRCLQRRDGFRFLAHDVLKIWNLAKKHVRRLLVMPAAPRCSLGNIASKHSVQSRATHPRSLVGRKIAGKPRP